MSCPHHPDPNHTFYCLKSACNLPLVPNNIIIFFYTILWLAILVQKFSNDHIDQWRRFFATDSASAAAADAEFLIGPPGPCLPNWFQTRRTGWKTTLENTAKYLILLQALTIRFLVRHFTPGMLRLSNQLLPFCLEIFRTEPTGWCSFLWPIESVDPLILTVGNTAES